VQRLYSSASSKLNANKTVPDKHCNFVENTPYLGTHFSMITSAGETCAIFMFCRPKSRVRLR